MSYLPELRASLVGAARHRYGSAQEPRTRRGASPRLNMGMLATGLAVAAALGVAAVALVTLGNRHTTTRTASSSPVTQATLRQAASQTLDQLALPPGAVSSRLVRGTPVELWSPSDKLAVSRRVDVYRVWRVRQAPDRVISFIQAHRLRGSSPGIGGEIAGSSSSRSAGSSSGPGHPVVITFQQATTVIGFPGTTVGIWRELAVDAVSLKGGGTALRVDSEAGWLMPRPASERIPVGVTRVTLLLALRALRGHGQVAIAAKQPVNASVSLFNSLPAAAPGAGVCTSAPNGYVRFSFERRGRRSPVAVAVWAPPCRRLDLTINGRPSLVLMSSSPTTPVGAIVEELLLRVGWPRRVSSSTQHGSSSLNSGQCSSHASSPPDQSQSAPGAGAGSCTSGSRSTTSAFSP